MVTSLRMQAESKTKGSGVFVSGDPRHSSAADPSEAADAPRMVEQTDAVVHTAYRQYGYRLAEIADHLGVHAAMVSPR
jgi:hypothetical protein